MKDKLVKILNKSAKTEAQGGPGGPYVPYGPVYMVCVLPDSLSADTIVKGLGPANTNFSFPVYVAWRHINGFPYLPYVNIKSSVYVNPKNPLEPDDSDCGDNNSYVRRTSPCFFESGLIEENFPHNGAGWRVHKRDVNFEFGPETVPCNDQNGSSTNWFNISWKMEAYRGTTEILDTAIIVMQKGLPNGATYFTAIGNGQPARTTTSWVLEPNCGATPKDYRLSDVPMRPEPGQRPDILSPGGGGFGPN